MKLRAFVRKDSNKLSIVCLPGKCFLFYNLHRQTGRQVTRYLLLHPILSFGDEPITKTARKDGWIFSEVMTEGEQQK